MGLLANEVRMRVAVFGRSSFTDLALVHEFVRGLDDDDVLVSGSATRVDFVAEMAARRRGLRMLVVPVDLRGLPAAGHERERAFSSRDLAAHVRILDNCDALVVFGEATYPLVEDLVALARREGKRVEVRRPRAVAAGSVLSAGPSS